jgi:hypothetical protein
VFVTELQKTVGSQEQQNRRSEHKRVGEKSKAIESDGALCADILHKPAGRERRPLPPQRKAGDHQAAKAEQQQPALGPRDLPAHHVQDERPAREQA